MADRRTVNDLLAASRAKIDRLEPHAVLAATREGAIVIDTRCAEQRRETGTIPGSVHVPLSVLYWRLDPASGYEDPSLADPGRQIILVCAHGYSSSIAAAYTIGRMLKSLTSRGVEVGTCGSWMNARGITDADLAEGICRSPMSQLAE